MASVIYPKYKEALLTGSTNTSLSAGDVRVILVDAADYTYSATHDMLDDVIAGARVATLAAGMSSKTVTDGTFDAADITFTAVSGDVSEALIVYIHTGTESTSRLVAYLDNATVTGLPVTPNGGNITVSWNASGIFTI